MSSRLVSPVFVGRRGELTALAAAAARTRQGEPTICLVSGEAGVGKSRLVAEASTLFEDAGCRVVKGMCVELGGTALPFPALVDALRALKRSTSAPELERILGAGRRELARLVPDLAPDEPETPYGDGGNISRLFELVLGLLGRAAGADGLVLVFEDLHWADRSTLDLVTFLARSLRDERVMLLLTYRSDEVDRRHPLRGAVAEIERLPAASRIELRRFDTAEVSEQLEGMLGAAAEPELAARVFERSEGNAFLVEEIVGIVRSDGAAKLPPSLRDLLLARIERLSPAARSLLRTAAAGVPITHQLLAAVAGLSSADLEETVREAVDRHALVPDDGQGSYTFRHALVRDAIYDDTLPGERVRLHTAYAQALEANPALAGGALEAATGRAQHWHSAHDVDRALTAAVEAAGLASASYAHPEAQRLLELALELWAQCSPDVRAEHDYVALLESAGWAAFSAGAEQRALALLDAGLLELGDDATGEQAARLHRRRAIVKRSLGRDPEPDLEAALEALRGSEPSPELAAVLAEQANVICLRFELGRGIALAERAIEVARSVGDRQHENTASTILGWALAYAGDTDRALDTLEAARRGSAALGDEERVLRAHILLSDVLEAQGRHQEALDAALAGVELARTAGLSRVHGIFLRGNAVESLLRLGRLEEAEELSNETALLETAGAPDSFLAELRTELALLRGAHEVAREQLPFFETADSSPQNTLPQAMLRCAVMHANGDPLAGCRIAVQTLAVVPLEIPRYVWPLVWTGLRAARGAQLPADSDEVSQLEAIARQLAATTPPATALRELSALELARIYGGNAVSTAEKAVAGCRAAADPYRLAYALWQLSEVAHDEDMLPVRQGAAAEAAEIAERIGAEGLLADIRAHARRTHLPLPQRTTTTERPNPFALTARELDVLTLIAAGRSNGQIGQALHISPKTASVHVSNILAKLSVSTRAEAAAAAVRDGLIATELA